MLYNRPYTSLFFVKSRPVTPPILVVEDDSEDRNLLIRLLTQAISNCEITGVANGEEAMQYLENAQQLPSLIILDIYMPLKNGFEVIQEVKNNPTFRPIPIIVLTASAVGTDVLKSYNLGVNAYLVKPATEQELSQFVHTIQMYWINNVRGLIQRRSNF